MPVRKKKIVKTPSKSKSPALLIPVATTSSTISPEPYNAADRIASRDTITENDQLQEPENTAEMEIKPSPEPESMLSAAEESRPIEASELNPPERTSAVPPAKSSTKTVLRVRKVMKKKIVKKLVPKGSIAAKKGDDAPKQDSIVLLPATAAKDPNPNPVTDITSQPDATEKTANPNSLCSEKNNAESKAECQQPDAKSDALKSRKVVRKIIVKKLVPKGSLAARKVKSDHLQGCIVSEKGPDPNPNPNPALTSTTQLDELEKTVNADTNQQLEAKIEGTEKDLDPKYNHIPAIISTIQPDDLHKTLNTGTKQQPEAKIEGAEKLDSCKFEEDIDVKEECKLMEGREAKEKEKEEVGLSERMKRRKAEIFIGGLDRDAKEEDIRSVFGKVGEILELRMMIDSQTGKSKGYAFLRYADPSQAKRAVDELSKVEIQGRTCGAAALQGKDMIFLGNIDKKLKKDDVVKLLKEAGVENIDTVTVVMDPTNADINRGFAFIELETNKDAQRAYKKLQKKDVLGMGRNIKVSWADSFNIPDEEEMQKVKSVYVEGVPDSWGEDKLLETFKRFGEIERVVLGKNVKSAKRKDIAFVNYRARESALSCINSFSCDQLTDNGSKVQLKLAFAKRLQKANQSNWQKSSSFTSLKELYKPTQDLQSQDCLAGTKRTFSALGENLHSDVRAYLRPRSDTSLGIAGPSYGAHSRVGISPHYQHQPNPTAYSTGSFHGAGSKIDAHQIRPGLPPYTSSLYHRYQM